MDPIHVNGYAEYSIIANIDPHLHYRPGGKIVELAKSYPHDIQIAHHGRRVNAKDLNQLVGLHINQYDQILLYVSTSLPDYDDAANRVADKFRNEDGKLNFEPRINPPIALGCIGTGPYALNGMLAYAAKDPQVRIAAVASASPKETKRDILSQFHLSEDQYYQMNGEIPDEFLDRSELIYVSSPPSYHFPHTLQAREDGKYVMVEKPVVVSRSELDELTKRFGYRDTRIVPVVHYLAKPVAEYLSQHLRRKLGNRPIRKIDAILFEEEGNDNLNEGRLKRLISKEGGGGQHRDTGTHLNALVTVSAGVQMQGCLEARMFDMYRDLPYETGAFVRSVGEGPQHEDVLIDTWVAKGTPAGSAMKKIRITADDMIVEGDFISSEVRIFSRTGLERIKCTGQDPHELLLKRTVAGIYAEHQGESAMPFRLSDVRNAHEAVDMAYAHVGGLDAMKRHSDPKVISDFISSGLKAGTSDLST